MSVQNTEEIIDAEMRKVFLNKRSFICTNFEAKIPRVSSPQRAANIYLQVKPISSDKIFGQICYLFLLQTDILLFSVAIFDPN